MNSIRRMAIKGFRNSLVVILFLGFLNITVASTPYTQSVNVKTGSDKSFEEFLNESGPFCVIKEDLIQRDSVLYIPDNVTLAFKGGRLLNANLVLGENVTIKNGDIQIAENGFIKLSNNCRVKNCSFTNVSYCRVGFGDLFAESSKDIVISNCTFAPQKRQTKGKCSSIDLRKCEGFLVEKVKSAYTEGENIIIYEGRGTVRKCECTGGWSGIGTSIYGTSVKNPKTGDPDARIIIKNNKVRNALAAGITINNYNTVCEGNTVLFENYTVSGPGIRLGHLHAPANNCTVTKNTIRWVNSKPSGASTSNRGISLDAGNNNIIIKNTIENVPEGIASSVSNKTGTQILNNKIISATANGISIYEDNDVANYCLVKGNDIRMQSGTGVWVRNCNAEIVKNKISFPVEKNPDIVSNFAYVGIRIEDNSQIKTDITDNIVKYSRVPVKAVFKGKEVLIDGNRFQTEEESSYSVGEKTVLKDNGNRIRLSRKH